MRSFRLRYTERLKAKTLSSILLERSKPKQVRICCSECDKHALCREFVGRFLCEACQNEWPAYLR